MMTIKKLREKEKLSKKEMAKLIAIGVGTLKKIEKGILPPRIKAEVLFKLSENFKISPADILKQEIST